MAIFRSNAHYIVHGCISPGSLTELPECQLEIASNKDILHQVSCIAVAPSLSIDYLELAASFFGNLASTSLTHQYIADSVYIDRMLQACKRYSSETEPLLE